MTTEATAPAGLTLHDARPFFERALAYGMQHGLIDRVKLDSFSVDAPKGMVQIARYFGSEYLRPELELARVRLVNLVSLCLEHQSGGDLHRAAVALRDHTLLSRSKGGSDMLKALIAMPQNSHFGMNERGGFADRHIPLLAKWTLRPYTDYQVEFAQRSHAAGLIDAAVWLAHDLGLDADTLEGSDKDAEAVIRTALLAHATRCTEMPDWPTFDKMITALRKKHGGEAAAAFKLPVPAEVPAEFRAVVTAVRDSVLADLPKMLDASLPARKLFDQTPAFMGRYYWIEDGLAEVDHHDRNASATWNKVTGGNTDDGTLLTLFLCVATAAKTPKTLLTEKAAAALLRKVRKTGLDSAKVQAYITQHAPFEHQDDYQRLWQTFVEEAEATLKSDLAHAHNDALALLRRECHIVE